MNTVTDGSFRGARVQLDDMHYINCTFDNCVLTYSGTGPVGLTNNSINNCSWAFEGAASETIKFLTALYTFDPQLIERTFDNIRRGGQQPTSDPIPEFPDTIP